MNNAIQELKKLALYDIMQRFPENPYPESLVPKLSDKKANGLTRCVIRFLQLKGHQAERIAVMGKLADNRESYIDVLGRYRVRGSTKWIPGQMTKGSADIHATINGKSVKIEIKVGRDKIRPDQVKYKQQIEQAGGIYFIATSFEQFYSWYNETFKQ